MQDRSLERLNHGYKNVFKSYVQIAFYILAYSIYSLQHSYRRYGTTFALLLWTLELERLKNFSAKTYSEWFTAVTISFEAMQGLLGRKITQKLIFNEEHLESLINSLVGTFRYTWTDHAYL